MTVSDGVERPRPEESDGERHPLVDIVLGRYEQAKAFRRSGCNLMGASVDTWIDRMDRAYNKVHEPEELHAFPMMRAYFGLIQLKVDATVAWGKNQFLNQRFTPFTISPTPDAELPEHLENQAKAAFKSLLMQKLMASGADPQMMLDPGTGALRMDILPQVQEMMRMEKERARKLNYNIASRACNRHTRVLKDQMIEGGWADEFSSVMFDQCLYPYGAMSVNRGPVIKWAWNGNRHVRKFVEGPIFRHIEVRRAYHAPDAKSAQDGAYFIEEVIRSQSDLHQMRQSEFSFEDNIDALMAAVQSGESGSEWSEQTISSDYGTSPIFGRSDDVVTIRMEGELLGSDLDSVPGLNLDPSEVVSVTIEICDGLLLWFDAKPFIEDQRGYFSASYVRDTRYAAGISVGMKLWDRQIRTNRLDFYQQASERMAHGPVIEQLQRAFSDEQFRFAPWTQVYSSANTTGERGIKFHQAAPLWRQLYQQFFSHLQLADHESGIPAFAAYGAQTGSVPTLGQSVMLHQGAAKGIQAWTENNDDRIIAPVVDMLYHQNLIEMNDPSIQADAKIHARGALGAVARELQATRITQALPQLIQGTQMQGENGQPLVPTSVADQAMRAFITELGLVTDDDGLPDPTTDYSQGAFSDAAPGLDMPPVDGRSPGVAGMN